MGIFNWLRRQPPASAPEPAERRVVKNVPALFEPILAFMERAAYVTFWATVPSWQVVHVRSFAEFSAALPERKYAMLVALSPAADSGAAVLGIARYRGLTLTANCHMEDCPEAARLA